MRISTVVVFLNLFALLAGCSCSKGGTDRTEIDSVRENVDLILVPEDQPWLAAVACPVVRALERHGSMPLLAAVSTRQKAAAQSLIEGIGRQRSLVFAATAGGGNSEAEANLGRALLSPNSRPLEASMFLAKKFWLRSEQVVVASTADAEAVLLGSAVAALQAVPLLLVEGDRDASALAVAIQDLESPRVVVASTASKSCPAWAERIAGSVEVADREGLERRMIALLEPSQVRNIVLTRSPESDNAGQTAWLAPYLSLARRAPLAFCRSPNPMEAEVEVRDLINRHGLKPRTVTILADYKSIGVHVVRIRPGTDPSLPHGDIATEPCVPRSLSETAPVGVGRIPFASLEDASVLIARGLLRERLGNEKPRIVMVANPVLENRPLPLCETVSRITVEEFKNFGVAADEFYHRPANSPEILAAARTADLLVYEGHIEHQDLFKPKRRLQPSDPVCSLDNSPIVVLQCCESLQKSVLRQIHDSGGVAVIGTTTPVHSTSGSAFVKAMSDGLLYRGETIGESLRDARNYFGCLQDLKNLRDHKQQAKSERVALSFRIWGDPELRFFPTPCSEPLKAPVAARWDDAGKLSVKLPPSRLPEIRNEKYVARMYPGSEAAGMVKRMKGESARHLTPLYFFKLPLPSDFVPSEAATIQVSEAKKPRAVFRVDPMERHLYILYYPAAETADRVATLRWTRKAGRMVP